MLQFLPGKFLEEFFKLGRKSFTLHRIPLLRIDSVVVQYLVCLRINQHGIEAGSISPPGSRHVTHSDSASSECSANGSADKPSDYTYNQRFGHLASIKGLVFDKSLGEYDEAVSGSILFKQLVNGTVRIQITHFFRIDCWEERYFLIKILLVGKANHVQGIFDRKPHSIKESGQNLLLPGRLLLVIGFTILVYVKDTAVRQDQRDVVNRSGIFRHIMECRA